MATNPEDTRFPAFRRYSNGRNYFKIVSADTFEEVQVIGKSRLVKRITATRFPEKQFIGDLLAGLAGKAETIDEETYERVKGGG